MLIISSLEIPKSEQKDLCKSISEFNVSSSSLDQKDIISSSNDLEIAIDITLQYSIKNL